MNSCAFIGRITQDLETRNVNGKTVCNFTLAVKRPHTSDKTDFIDFSVWNRGAEYLVKYGEKGNLVSALGHMETSISEKDGVKRKYSSIACDEVSILVYTKNRENTSKEDAVTEYTGFHDLGPGYGEGNPYVDNGKQEEFPF